MVACDNTPSSDKSSCFLAAFLSCHDDKVLWRRESLLGGNASVPVVVSFWIPRNTRLCVGPRVFLQPLGNGAWGILTVQCVKMC